MTVTSSYVFGTTVLPQSDTASPVVYRYCKNARTLVDSERGSLKKCINAVSQTSLSCQGVSCSVRTSNNRLPSNEEPWRWDWCHCKECELKVNFFLSLPVQGHTVPVNSMSNCASSLILKGEWEPPRVPDVSEGCRKENQEPSKLLPFVVIFLLSSKLLKLLPTTSCGHVRNWHFG